MPPHYCLPQSTSTLGSNLWSNIGTVVFFIALGVFVFVCFFFRITRLCRSPGQEKIFVVQKHTLSPFRQRFRVCLRIRNLPCVVECASSQELAEAMSLLQQLYYAEALRVGCFIISDQHLSDYFTRQMALLIDTTTTTALSPISSSSSSCSSSSSSAISAGAAPSSSSTLSKTFRFDDLTSPTDRHDFDQLLGAAMNCDIALARNVLLRRAALQHQASISSSSPSAAQCSAAQMLNCRTADGLPLLLVAVRSMYALHDADLIDAFEFVRYIVSFGADINATVNNDNIVVAVRSRDCSTFCFISCMCECSQTFCWKPLLSHAAS
jgi:hypothetical protein